MALKTTFSRDNCRKAHQGKAELLGLYMNIRILPFFKYNAPVMFRFYEVHIIDDNITEAPTLDVYLAQYFIIIKH